MVLIEDWRLSRASPKASSTVFAWLVTAIGLLFSRRASSTQRLSSGPDLLPFSSEKCASIRVMCSLNLDKPWFKVEFTKAVNFSFPGMLLSVLT